MGLRTPQTLQRAKPNSASPRANFTANPQATQISGAFINTLDQGVRAAAARDEKKEKANQDFIKTIFQNDLDTARVQSEAELADLNGVEAIGESKNIREKYLDAIQDRLNKVPEKYRNSLDMRAEAVRAAGKFDRFSIGYTHAEGRKVEEESYNTRIANEMNDMVDHAHDVDYLATTGKARVSSGIRRKLERTYGDDPSVILPSGITVGEAIEAEVTAGVSESIRKSIQQQVNVNAYDKAHETLNAMIDDITPDDRTKIMKSINAGLKTREDTTSMALAEEAWRLAEGDLVMAEQYILARSGGNGAMFKKAMSHAQTKASIRAKQKQKNVEDSYANLYDQMVNTGEMDPMAFKRLSKTDPDAANKLVNTLNKNKGGPAVVTDQDALARINRQFDNMPDEELVKVNINKQYQSLISADDRDLLLRRQRYAQKQIESKYSHGQKWNTGIYNEISRDFSKQLGFMPGSEEDSKLKSLVQDRYSQIITENPKITEQEIRRKVIREVRDKVVNTESYENSDRGAIKTFLFGRESVRAELPDSLSPARETDIDSSWVRKIQSARQQAGKRPYTEDELSDYANYLQNSNRGINLTKPAP